MGKSTTPKYRVNVDGMVNVWDIKRNGKPTNDNLETYVYRLGKSYEINGCNEHISNAIGYVPYPSKAFVETNVARNPVTVATWKAGAFQVW